MQRRTVAYVLGGVAAVVALVLLADFVMVSDEERLEPFLDAVTGDVTPERIETALGFTDPARQPVEVQALGTTQVYETSEALGTHARDALRPLVGETLRILGESIEVEDDRATVSVRFVSGRAGMANAYFDLRKHGDDWLLAEVRVTR